MSLTLNKQIIFPVEIYSIILEKNIFDQVIQIVEKEKDSWNKNLLNVKAKTSGWDGLRFAEIRQIADFCCTKILPKIHSESDWKCEEAWINYYNKGDFANIHNHAAKSYSAIFIAKSESSSLVFKNIANIYGYGNYKTPHKDEKINEQDGLLILFPSWVLHEVEECTGERITVALNFYNETY